MAPIPWNPDRKTLAEFSEAGMFALGMVLAPLALWKGNARTAVMLWTAAVVVRAVGLIRPNWLRPVFVGMTLATWPIGWVVSNCLLAIVYYGVVTPIGLGRRLLGREPLSRGFDREAATYWVARPPAASPSGYFRQF